MWTRIFFQVKTVKPHVRSEHEITSAEICKHNRHSGLTLQPVAWRAPGQYYRRWSPGPGANALAGQGGGHAPLPALGPVALHRTRYTARCGPNRGPAKLTHAPASFVASSGVTGNTRSIQAKSDAPKKVRKLAPRL